MTEDRAWGGYKLSRSNTMFNISKNKNQKSNTEEQNKKQTQTVLETYDDIKLFKLPLKLKI